MDQSTIIAIAVTALILQCIILSWIISDATQTKRKIKIENAQTKLLMLIAEKLGVDRELILESTKEL